MEGFLPILFLGVVLKIPVGLLLYLVWWAIHQQPDAEETPPGSDDHSFRRFGREPRGPRGPRRDPHAPDARPLPDCPPGGRTRVTPSPAPVRAGGAGVGSHGWTGAERV